MRCSRKTIFLVSAPLITILGVLAGLWHNAHVVVSPPEPPHRATATVELTATTSHVPVVITVPLTALSTHLEAGLPKEFKFDVDNNGVHTYGTLTRDAVSTHNDAAEKKTFAATEVAGRVQVVKKVIFEASVGIDVKGNIGVSVSPTVAKDWAVNPNLTLTITLAKAAAKTPFGDLDITGLVRGEVEKLADGQKAALGESVKKSLDVRTKVEKVWNSLNAVHRLTADPPAWLRVTPRGVTFRNFQYTQNSIESGLALKLETRVFVQDAAPEVLPTPLPNLDSADTLADEITLMLPIEVSYGVINAQLTKALAADKGFPLLGGGQVTVTGAVLRPYGDGVLLTVNFRAAQGQWNRASGHLYVAGNPGFDVGTSQFQVDNLEYTTETKALLLKGVDWLAHSALLDQMKAVTKIDLSEQMTKVRRQAREQAAGQLDELKKRLPESVVADVSVTGVEIEHLTFAQEKVVVLVKAKGKLSLRLR